MNDSVLSHIELKDSQIVGLAFEVDEAQAGLPMLSYTFNVTSDYLDLPHKDNFADSCQVSLRVEMTGHSVKSSKVTKRTKAKFRIEIQIRGLLDGHFADEVPIGDRRLNLYTNAVSLLYGEARSQVAALSAVSALGRVILPTVNPAKIAEDAMSATDNTPE